MTKMTEKQIILHIGLSKTGSTYIQKKILPFLENTFSITPASIMSGAKDNPLYFLFHQTLPPDRKNKKYSDENSRKAIQDYISSLDKDKIIISNEHFSTVQFRFKFEYDCYGDLKKIFPESKAFLVLRKQDEWANSAYNETVKMPDWRRRKPLYKVWKYYNGRFMNDSPIHGINWYELVRETYDYFGRENTLILPYELFVNEPEKFLSEFYNYFAITPYYPEKTSRENAKVDKIKIKPLKEKFDAWLENLSENKQKFVKKNSRALYKLIDSFSCDYKIEAFTPEQKQQIMEIHGEDNKKLAELTGIDLGYYGYY